MPGSDWRPTCSVEVLRARAEMLREVRSFFAERDVVEVDTPVLAQTGVTDPAIESFGVEVRGRRWYLQTSTEYHQKRLLAAGAPSNVTISHVFRAEEQGALHNVEFTMVEWYRLGFSLEELMSEVVELVDVVLGRAACRRLTYAELMRGAFGELPSTVNALRALLGVESDAELADASRSQLEDLAASRALAGIDGRLFVTDYPAHQAALAALRETLDGTVADRFELVIDGVEVANGYNELTDAQVLADRMAHDVMARERNRQAAMTPDERLLAAQRSGLPACAGVALGFDRLLMLKLGARDIREVLPFAGDTA